MFLVKPSALSHEETHVGISEDMFECNKIICVGFQWNIGDYLDVNITMHDNTISQIQNFVATFIFSRRCISIQFSVLLIALNVFLVQRPFWHREEQT